MISRDRCPHEPVQNLIRNADSIDRPVGDRIAEKPVLNGSRDGGCVGAAGCRPVVWVQFEKAPDQAGEKAGKGGADPQLVSVVEFDPIQGCCHAIDIRGRVEGCLRRIG